MNNLSSKKVRKDFIDFFKSKEHSFVRSSPVMPIDDETLLFTNAGMNQFKKIFLGSERPKHKRVVNSQKCIRVSGKHNDLEEVGEDEFHHTFFEMLGNWSFGDFYKKEIIKWSWELLTEVWKLDKNRLWVTVYKNDDEAEKIWKKYTDIDSNKILKFGNKDNFWEMGDTGPCGPCSEIHYYVGGDLTKQTKNGVNRHDDYRELWNLVFVEYNRNSKGDLIELPLKHVDTGAGLERLVSTLNNTTDHYKTDLFYPIIKDVEKISGKDYTYKNGMPHRVIADHLRMISFSLADGIMPSNEGRGYVVRRILRRAIRFGRVLGMKDEFLHILVNRLVKILGEAYPELLEKKAHIQKVIKSEEVSFGKTLDRGLILFDKIVSSLNSSNITGNDAFKLYDTYGFPLDLTQLLAKERNLKVDVDSFDTLMLKQKENARNQSKFSSDTDTDEWVELIHSNTNSEFIGYNEDEAKSKICMYRKKNNKIELVLSCTPFYAESGGQVGDTGQIESDNFSFKVLNTYKDGDSICHYGDLIKGDLSKMANEEVLLRINNGRRKKIKLNHTATHLLHKALKNILGDHVQQAGSLVSENRLRFDLTHYQKVNVNEIEEIENIVNEIIRNNLLLNINISSFEEAKKSGAEALFGEKYGNEVRVVDIPSFSKELCGGTHVNSTGDIGLFKIISESSLSAGVRRMEAVTGVEAFNYLRNKALLLNDIAIKLNCSDSDLYERVSILENSIKSYKKEIKTVNVNNAKKIIKDLYINKTTIKKISFISKMININIPPKELNDIALEILLNDGVSLLAVSANKSNILVCSVTRNISNSYKASDFLKNIANNFNLNAGGSNHMAIMSFNDKILLRQALEYGQQIIKENLKTL